MKRFYSINLTDDELTALDDGQGWWADGDYVSLGVNAGAVSVDLCVNGETHDNWITLRELPDDICGRLFGGNPMIIKAEKQIAGFVLVDSAGNHPQEGFTHPTAEAALGDAEVLWPIDSDWHGHYVDGGYRIIA